MDLIKFAYGAEANLYHDVLRVSANASDQEVQSAFVTRRYELFNELQSASISDTINTTYVGTDGTPVMMTVRHFTEKKMDALIASYRLLSDSEKRRQYNMSLSLAATKQKRKGRVSLSPQGVQDLKDSPTSSTLVESEGTSVNQPEDNGNFSDSFGTDDSRFMATSYNPNAGPTPTKRGPKLNAKKRLFDSPVGSSSNDGFGKDGSTSPLSSGTTSLGEQVRIIDDTVAADPSYSFGTDTAADDASTEADFTEDEETEDGDYDELENLDIDDSSRGSNIKLKSSSSQSYNTPETSLSAGSRKVTWSEEAQNSASVQEDRRKKRSTENIQESSAVVSWLRSNHLTGSADVVENIGKEISGVASDTMLAFSQIFNAFVIDGEAIDSMAVNIGDAAEDLSSRSPNYAKR
jgi:hypothetical protein